MEDPPDAAVGRDLPELHRLFLKNQLFVSVVLALFIVGLPTFFMGVDERLHFNPHKYIPVIGRMSGEDRANFTRGDNVFIDCEILGGSPKEESAFKRKHPIGSIVRLLYEEDSFDGYRYCYTYPFTKKLFIVGCVFISCGLLLLAWNLFFNKDEPFTEDEWRRLNAYLTLLEEQRAHRIDRIYPADAEIIVTADAVAL